ncbi:hypothetical protein GcC1_110019 [Golovinomyces cichoracearum]|uniref:Uncharacterized protein n=1 Tax=Golovinomyces cichoracearum TaxID=62708 RepID=A0A420I8V7_9PEZI|nr:hypothetical protein GcC1_110019 [Golovinomyces cichoracearum]
MTTGDTARIFTLLLLCVFSLYQSAAYPLYFNEILNTHTLLRAHSRGTDQPRRRAVGPIIGDIATTVFGNAIAGAIGPIFEEIGTSLSSGMSGNPNGSGDQRHDDEVIEYQTLLEPYHEQTTNEISRSKFKQDSEESQQTPEQ